MHVATPHLSQGWLSGGMASHNDLWIISIRSSILLQHRLNTWESEQQVGTQTSTGNWHEVQPQGRVQETDAGMHHVANPLPEQSSLDTVSSECTLSLLLYLCHCSDSHSPESA